MQWELGQKYNLNWYEIQFSFWKEVWLVIDEHIAMHGQNSNVWEFVLKLAVHCFVVGWMKLTYLEGN